MNMNFAEGEVRALKRTKSFRNTLPRKPGFAAGARRVWGRLRALLCSLQLRRPRAAYARS